MAQPQPDDFATDSTGAEVRRLARLALPVAGTQFSSMLLGFVDTMMLGRYDIHAMAASAAANVFTFGTIFFANGILFGLDPLIAQAHGARDGQRAGLAFQRGIVLALLLSVPTGLSWLWADDFLRLTAQDAAIIPLADTYVKALIPGIPFFLVYSILRQYLQGRELVRPALGVILVANVFNVVANWALIFSNLGCPELGIEGAGLATTLTRIMSLVLLVAWVAFGRLHEGAWLPWSRAAFSPRGLAGIFAIGLPVALQTSTEMWAFGASTLMAGSLGALVLDAHIIALNMAAMSFQIPLGIAIGATTRVGNLLGAGHPRGAQRAAWVAMALGAAVMSVFAVLFVLLRDWLPRVYTPDVEVGAMAAAILPIAAAFQIFDGIQVVGCGVLRGMGRTVPAVVFNLVGYWLIGLPLGWWLGPGGGGGLEGIWWGLVLGLGVVAGSLVIWIRVRGPATLGARIEPAS